MAEIISKEANDRDKPISLFGTRSIRYPVKGLSPIFNNNYLRWKIYQVRKRRTFKIQALTEKVGVGFLTLESWGGGWLGVPEKIVLLQKSTGGTHFYYFNHVVDRKQTKSYLYDRPTYIYVDPE